MRNPANCLSGLQLKDKWKVGDMVGNYVGNTGGKFSICYEVSHQDGKSGFLKALDFSGALGAVDPTTELHKLTEAFLYEKELLEICRPMSRIVTALDFGTVELGDPMKAEIVPYIIFEIAEKTVRSVISARMRPPFAWIMECMHQATVGMNQLHTKQISHQDIKPSNALIFSDQGLKIADLGRSVRKGQYVLHELEDWPGDWGYAPPEIAYGYLDPEFNVRRLSSDIYMLGSFAVSLLTGLQLTAWLITVLPDELRPPKWNGNYEGNYSEVISHVEQAFATALEKINDHIGVQEKFVEDMIDCVRELCQPNPGKRGHPRTHAIVGDAGNPFNLERYISRFNYLVLHARIYDHRIHRTSI